MWIAGRGPGPPAWQSRGAPSQPPADLSDVQDFRTIAVDTIHGCGIRATGTLWCWGRNAEGQLGTGDTADRDAPTRVGTESDWASVSVGCFHTCARRADGSAWCTGANDDGHLGTGDLDSTKRDDAGPLDEAIVKSSAWPATPTMPHAPR